MKSGGNPDQSNNENNIVALPSGLIQLKKTNSIM
jgi:hypothetical protein